MIVKSLYSACVEIRTKNLKILCDPWFTQGIGIGSWYLFPEPKDPFEVIGNPDLIYVSHIHNDHYDKLFIKKLYSKYGRKKILIPKFKKNYLELRAKLDGFDVEPISHVNIKKTNIHIVPNDQNDPSDIDSALYVNCEATNRNMINLNDNQWNMRQNSELKKIMKNYTNELDLLALGYSGAGPYPQTFFDTKKELKELEKEAKRKKEKFFNQYKRYTNFFNSRYHFPFAGSYILGGKHFYLNKFRGNPDPIEVKKFDRKAVILEDFGGSINLISNKAAKVRRKKYNLNKYKSYLNKIKKKKYDFDIDFKNFDYDKINFRRMIMSSYFRACSKIAIKSDYFLIFKLQNHNKTISTFMLNLNKKKFDLKIFNGEKKLKIKQKHEIFIDYRLFFGLLSGVYHWGDAMGGSLFLTRRTPNIYNPSIQKFLIFFQTN